MSDLPSHRCVKILDQVLISSENGELIYRVTSCLSTSTKVSTVTAVGVQLKPNNLTEVNWEYEVNACTNALLLKGRFDHRFVCINLSDYPIVRVHVIPEIPKSSSNRFDNDIYDVYSNLKVNECALVIVNTNLAFTVLKRVTIVLPKS